MYEIAYAVSNTVCLEIVYMNLNKLLYYGREAM